MTTWMHIKMMATDLNVHNAHPMTLLMHNVHFVDHSYQLVNFNAAGKREFCLHHHQSI